MLFEAFLTFCTGAIALLGMVVIIFVLLGIEKVWYSILWESAGLCSSKTSAHLIAIPCTIMTIVGIYGLGWLILQ